MKNKEIRLNKKQFGLFNQADQFAIFDEDGYGDFEDFNHELDKLFEKFDNVIITKAEQIYGEKNGKREELHPEASESYDIALDIIKSLEKANNTK